MSRTRSETAAVEADGVELDGVQIDSVQIDGAELDGVEIDTDPARLDVAMIHAFLTASYWAEGRSLEQVRRSLRNSLNFGLYLDGRQVGFARVVSDRVGFAYVADVFVLPEARGRGLGKRLLRAVVTHEELCEVRHWTLFTRDAHGLYAREGFSALRGERFERFLYRAAGEPGGSNARGTATPRSGPAAPGGAPPPEGSCPE